MGGNWKDERKGEGEILPYDSIWVSLPFFLIEGGLGGVRFPILFANHLQMND